jgi:hypothetical protein
MGGSRGALGASATPVGKYYIKNKVYPEELNNR